VNQVKLSIEFEMGYCNGYMHCRVLNNDKEIFHIKNNDDEVLKLDFATVWPTTLRFELTNKDQNKDTVVDKNGNILYNKFMRLKKFTVNNLPLIEPNLYKIAVFGGHNETFWDRNETATIELTKNNPARWLLSLNNVIYLREAT
jgi:hypothetical protein